MSALHVHYCSTPDCDCSMTCRREDCEQIGWTCPVCEDEQMSDYYQACGDQPCLPLEPQPVREVEIF